MNLVQRIRSVSFVALSVLLFVFTMLSLTSNFTAHAQSPELGNLSGFELEHFHSSFSSEKRHVFPELFGHIQSALEKETRLNAVSPAAGKIYLSCDGPACREVELTVRVGGPTGPVVYTDDTATYALFFGSRFFSVERRPQNIARNLIERLGNAYEDAQAGQ